MREEACSGLFLRLEHLAAAVHSGLEIDVVRPAQFARILVLDIGRLRQRVGGAAHPAPRWRRFSFRDGHGPAPAARWEAGLIEDDAGPSQAPWSASGLGAGASRSRPSPSRRHRAPIALISADFSRRPRAPPGPRRGPRRGPRAGAPPAPAAWRCAAADWAISRPAARPRARSARARIG